MSAPAVSGTVVLMVSLAFLTLLGLVIVLNFFSLPANWIMVLLIALWSWLNPDPGQMGMMFFATILFFAVAGELVEYVAQAWGAKKYGSSRPATISSFIGAIVGAFLGMSFFFGFGAVIGAFVGGGLCCYCVETARGVPKEIAWKSTKGVLLGRCLGIVTKCGIGVLILFVTKNAMAE